MSLGAPRLFAPAALKGAVAGLLLALSACSGAAREARPSAAVATATIAAAIEKAPAEKAAVEGAVDPKVAHIQVIALSDFHGWLSPLEPGRGFTKYYGGIANFAGQLKHRERLRPESSILVDNGDLWTGPTESTFLRGEPVVEAYNALGFAAANIANHEFDFGVEILRARASEAKFPFLGANIVKAGTTDAPDFVKPFIVVERDGVKVAIVGLSYIDTPKTTLAKHVAGLEFQDYAATLKRVVPEAKAAGAEVVVVLFHDAVDRAEKTLSSLGDLGITVVVAGQNHHKEAAMVGTTPIVNPGPFGRSYVRYDVDVDRATRKVTNVKHEIVDITGEIGSPSYPPSPELSAIVEGARQKARAMSSEVLGRISKPLPVGSFGDSPLGHFIVDTWLSAFPEVDVAICNHGALRQPLPAGPVTLSDLLSVLPFENNLYIVKLTGKQLKEELAIDGPVVAGITWTYKESGGARTVASLVDRLGKPLDDNKKYSVIINDFMYTGGDGYRFKEQDGTPEDTGVSFRQPVIRALRLVEGTNRKTEPQSTARAKLVHGARP